MSDAATALANDLVIDITTTGAKTGEPRRLEIWFHRIGGKYYITGSPGTRSWYANLLEHPQFTIHFKETAQADLAAIARPVTDEEEKASSLPSRRRRANQARPIPGRRRHRRLGSPQPLDRVRPRALTAPRRHGPRPVQLLVHHADEPQPKQSLPSRHRPLVPMRIRIAKRGR